MNALALHESHHSLGAIFGEVGEEETVSHYGDPRQEYDYLRSSAGVLDLSFRGRLCLTGADRVRLLHGQVTNDVQRLQRGQGCYAALVSAKGRVESDLNIYALTDELLLDFEPGVSTKIQERLNHYIIADDVQVIDVAPHYGLLSVQGPQAWEVVATLGFEWTRPKSGRDFSSATLPELGDYYVMNQPRTGSEGFDVFVPMAALGMTWDKLVAAARNAGGGPAGWTALEWARIEAGIPRFGADLDETNLASEGGDRFIAEAISYAKGCYIGQEVIARIRTYGQVAKALRGLILVDASSPLPSRGTRLFKEGREVGYLTSVIDSPALRQRIALGYVRRECNTPGTELACGKGGQETTAKVVALPFSGENPY